MATNKLVLRDVDQIMADFKPIYQPIFPLFLSGAQKHALEVGKLNFKRMEAVGDIRSQHVTPKDTVLKQIVAKESSKTFKIYPFASQFVQSTLQDGAQSEDIVRQVLDDRPLGGMLSLDRSERAVCDAAIPSPVVWALFLGRSFHSGE